MNLDLYIQVARLNNLTGTWLLLFPTLWSLIMHSKNLQDFVWVPLFFIGAFLMRSAGCIINDIFDMKIDSKVVRTKFRPLSSGKLSTSSAVLFLICILFLSSLLLFFLDLKSVMLCIFSMLLVIIYPITKRYLKYPQFFLGITFNLGVLIACSVINQGQIKLSSVMLYFGCMFWTIYYDTIYAKQDVEDDIKLGLYTTANSIFVSDKWLKRFISIAFSLWCLAGLLSGMGLAYYICLIISFFLMKYRFNMFKKDGKCFELFKYNVFVGLILFLGCLLSLHFI